MKRNIARKLRKEREKLNRLIDRALKNGTPISETYEIMKHSRKVNELLNDDMDRRNFL